jgi:hypothetical protein
MANSPATLGKDTAFGMQTEYLYRKNDQRQLDPEKIILY